MASSSQRLRRRFGQVSIWICRGVLHEVPPPDPLMWRPETGGVRSGRSCQDFTGCDKSMVLLGSSECGLVAAVAQWLLGLRVVVQDTAGQIVYPSIGGEVDDYQLKIMYCDDPQSTKGLQRTEDTYYIDNMKEVLLDSMGGDYVSGRVDWTLAFRKTFGSSVSRLLHFPDVIGETIGSAARIYSAQDRQGTTGAGGRHYLVNCLGSKRKYPESASVDLVCERLPEFADARDSMNAAMERSYSEVCSKFKTVVVTLRNICTCTECQPQDCHRFKPGIIDLTARAASSSSDLDNKPVDYCLRQLDFTLIQLIRQLTAIASMPADLYPKRRGLEALFERVQSRCSTSRDIDDIACLITLESMSLLDLVILIFGVEVPFSYPDRVNHWESRTTVIVNGGLCFVMNGVMKIPSCAEESQCVHIIPGQIEWKQKVYYRVRDGKWGSPRMIMPPLVFPVSNIEYTAHMQLLTDMMARATVTESPECLRMTYEVKTQYGISCMPPGGLSQYMSKATSGISCTGKVCEPFKGLEEKFLFISYSMRLPFDAPKNPQLSCNTPEKTNIILFGDHDIACCTSLGHSIHDTNVIIQDRECIACCARRALATEKPQEQIIFSRMTAEDVEHLLNAPGFWYKGDGVSKLRFLRFDCVFTLRLLSIDEYNQIEKIHQHSNKIKS